MTLGVCEYGIDDAGTSRPKALELRDLLQETAWKHGFTPGQLRAGSRDKRLVRARQEFMFHARKMGKTLNEIGTYINRDHTTIMYGISAHMQREGMI